MNFAHVMLMIGMAAFAGCCCSSETFGGSGGSSSCSLGTYGSACTDFCNQMGGGTDCFGQCIDGVQAEGLGDADTCCQYTYRQTCEQICAEYGSYGVDECMNDCAQQFSSQGFSMDSCALPV